MKLSDMSREEQLKLIAEATKQQKLREKEEDNQIIASMAAGAIPTPPEIRAILTRRLFGHRAHLMSHHPYWKELKLRDGFDALYGAALAAKVDVTRHNAALGAYATGHGEFRNHVDHTVANPSQKDVFAYCCIAFAIVDNNRRLRDIRPDLDKVYPDLVKKHFENAVTAFVMTLRENLTHGRVVISNWTISHGEEGTRGAMLFDANELLRFGKWNTVAAEYITTQEGGKVDVAAAITDHFKLLTGFYQDITDFLARNRHADEIDYHDIEDAQQETAFLQWMNILVAQISAGRDPYDYLHRFVTEQQWRKIMRFPKHSKEQVDFIISLKSTQATCTDELRAKVYKLFGVKAD